MSLVSAFMNVSLQAQVSPALQADINSAFQKLNSGDFPGSRSLIKKYTDSASIQAMLTAISDGKTMLHLAANFSSVGAAINLVALISNQSLRVSKAFQTQVLMARDSNGRTAVDYATSNNNAQLASMLNGLVGSSSSSSSPSSSSPQPAQSPAPASTPSSTLQADINTAFQLVGTSDYMGFSRVVKKYYDAPSITAILTAVQNGQTLMQAASNNPDEGTAALMVVKLVNQARIVSGAFQKQAITAKDGTGKSAVDYAAANGYTSLTGLFNQLLAVQ